MSAGFPDQGSQVATVLLYILGLTLLTHCLSRRLAVEKVASWTSIRQISWARLCIILLFIDSWLFFASCNILIFGLGLGMQPYCSASIISCVVFYTTSKILTYFFLLEKVHVVWTSNHNNSRLSNPMFIVSLVTVSLYAILFVLLLIGKIHYLRDDGVCIIGVKPFATIPLLAYDAYLNVFLTALFLWPTLRHQRLAVRSIARRTLVAAAVALGVSVVNMGILTGFKGHEVAWVCLSCCGYDVVINALALFWVTSSPSSNEQVQPTAASENSNGLPSFVTRPSLISRPEVYSDADFHFHFSSVKSETIQTTSRSIVTLPVAYLKQGSNVKRSSLGCEP